MKFEFEKVSDTSMRFTPNQEIPAVVNKIADVINEQLTQSNGQANVLGPDGIVELIKSKAPDITAEILFEEIAQADVAPIKSTVEAKGDTVAEAVAG